MPRSLRFLFPAFALFYVALRMWAAFHVYSVVDESQDFMLTREMFGQIPSFFARTQLPDQARLPHLVSAPITFFWKADPLIPARTLFFGFHLLYLWLSYKLLFFVTKNRAAALLYVLLLLTSCYFAGFSYFSNTTSGWLYLFFHILCINLFWRSFTEQRASAVFPDYMLLAILLGCCTASSLFGVLLFPAFFVFHILHNRGRKIKVHSVPPGVPILWSGFFILSVLLIQKLAIAASLKSTLVLTEAFCGFLGFIYLCMKNRSKSSPIIETSPYLLWAAICLTAACVTLTLSPIYLNLDNVLAIPDWVSRFRHGPVVENRRPFDAARILFLKFGWVSSLALVVPALYCIRKKWGLWRNEFYFFICLVFLFNFSVIGSSSFLIAHYFLAVFPFLYLCLVKFWMDCRRRSKAMAVFASFLIVLVIADNQLRYFRWYPYSHWDGIQYGNQEIGSINRAGMLSFEVFPQVAEYMRTLHIPALGNFTLLLGIPGKKLNGISFTHFKGSVLKEALLQKGIKNVTVVAEWEKPDMVMLADFNPPASDDMESIQADYEKIKSFEMKGIDILSLWRLKRAPTP